MVVSGVRPRNTCSCSVEAMVTRRRPPLRSTGYFSLESPTRGLKRRVEAMVRLLLLAGMIDRLPRVLIIPLSTHPSPTKQHHSASRRS